jgi:hypothetical protein
MFRIGVRGDVRDVSFLETDILRIGRSVRSKDARIRGQQLGYQPQRTLVRYLAGGQRNRSYSQLCLGSLPGYRKAGTLQKKYDTAGY